MKKIMVLFLLVCMLGCYGVEIIDLPRRVVVVDKWIDLPHYWVQFHPVDGWQDRIYSMDPVSWTNAIVGATNNFYGW